MHRMEHVFNTIGMVNIVSRVSWIGVSAQTASFAEYGGNASGRRWLFPKARLRMNVHMVICPSPMGRSGAMIDWTYCLDGALSTTDILLRSSRVSVNNCATAHSHVGQPRSSYGRPWPVKYGDTTCLRACVHRVTGISRLLGIINHCAVRQTAS